ncbi:MAG: efflux RND transporter periplasmic adaptor subunit [Gemmatimonadota bacterium]
MTKLRKRVGSIVLLLTVVAAGAGLTIWKVANIKEANAASANQPEPMELITTATAQEREHQATTTAIGTVFALRSITLRNEISGTVREVRLVPGQIVEAGAVLVALDVSVEQAELRAQEAQAALAETVLQRVERLSNDRAAPQTELDRARAERDVALAQIARTKAIIAKKTIRAPFRARVGIADVHPGQYLNEGTQLTTLQGVDAAANIDFAVSQDVAAGLRRGDKVSIHAGDTPMPARIVAIDARVDPATRNAKVRATITGGAAVLAPGASVRVQVPAGASAVAVAIPVSALRKGPGGDHVFVIMPEKDGKARAQLRAVESGTVLGDEVLIYKGVTAGEQIAATGSFKLRDGVLVTTAAETASH